MMTEDTLDQLYRELLLLRRGEDLSQEEREILEILLRTRPEARRMARQLERLASLEARATSLPAPAGMHARLRARLLENPQPAPLRSWDSIAWSAAGLLAAVLCYAAAWLWLPALPWSDWGQSVMAQLTGLAPGVNVSMDAPLVASITLRTLLYASLAAVALLAFLLGIDRDRHLPLHPEIRKERL